MHAARGFVEWYNGHPDAADTDFDLGRVETAVIVGNGNVALDCARLLCKQPSELVGSDVAEHAAAALAGSAVRQVVLLGRRGVLQAAFTIKELRERTKPPPRDRHATAARPPRDRRATAARPPRVTATCNRHRWQWRLEPNTSVFGSVNIMMGSGLFGKLNTLSEKGRAFLGGRSAA